MRRGPEVIIEADEDLLIQLLLNLLDNALKHTPAGGHIQVGWSLSGENVVLSIADTGSGITEEHMPHLFDRFYRVDQARGRADGGAGLGLAICQWIAQAHGGTINVTSQPGRGSRFDVSLPVS